MQGRWFRFYDSVVDDPKVQRLPLALFRLWVNILCLASRNNGKMPSLVDMTFSLRMTEKQVIDGLKSLEKAGLVDAEVDGASTPHNWNGRQFKADVSTERVKRFRERQPKRDETVSCNVPETDTEAETEQIQKETPSLRSGDSAPAVSEPVSPTASEENEIPAFLDRRGKKHRLPENFEPDRAAAIAFWRRKEREDLCRDVEDQVTMFKAHYRKAGTRWEDWASTWVGWYSRAIEMTRAPAVSRNAPIVSIFDEPQKAAACR